MTYMSCRSSPAASKIYDSSTLESCVSCYSSNPRLHKQNPAVSYAIAMHNHHFHTPASSVIESKQSYIINLDAIDEKVERLSNNTVYHTNFIFRKPIITQL